MKNKLGELGYLASFSGKLSDRTLHKYFVPPVFDTSNTRNFYMKAEEQLNKLTKKIETLSENKTLNIVGVRRWSFLSENGIVQVLIPQGTRKAALHGYSLKGFQRQLSQSN